MTAGITASVHVPGVLILVDLPARPGLPELPARPPAGNSTPRPEPEPRWPVEEPAAAEEPPPLPTPIFDQMLSHWFADDRAKPARPGEWATPADDVRQAAEAAVGTLDDVEFTASGLPTRQPGAQLAPGSVAPRQPQPADPSFRDPAAVRNNLSRHYSGMRAARHRVAPEPKAEQ